MQFPFHRGYNFERQDIQNNKLNEIIYDLSVNCLSSIYLSKYNNSALERLSIQTKGSLGQRLKEFYMGNIHWSAKQENNMNIAQCRHLLVFIRPMTSLLRLCQFRYRKKFLFQEMFPPFERCIQIRSSKTSFSLLLIYI